MKPKLRLYRVFENPRIEKYHIGLDCDGIEFISLDTYGKKEADFWVITMAFKLGAKMVGLSTLQKEAKSEKAKS